MYTVIPGYVIILVYPDGTRTVHRAVRKEDADATQAG